MKSNSLFFFFFLINLGSPLSAQSIFITEDFTVTDIDGNQHRLYEYLDDCKSVLVEFIAPWCGPCIDNHNTGIAQEVYANRGPLSIHDDVIVLYIDTDLTSTLDTSWSTDFTNVDFPVIDLDPSEYAQFEDNYLDYLGSWPHTLAICPNRSAYYINLESTSQVISYLIMPKVNAGPDIEVTCSTSTINASITNVDSSYITFFWGELLPNGSGTNPPFPANELNPQINEVGTFVLFSRNKINGYSSQDTVVVTRINNDLPDLFTSEDTIWVPCFGDTVDIFTQGLFGGGIWEREWTTTHGNIVDIVDTSQHHIHVQGGGTYTTTTYDNSNGCISSLDIIVIEPLALMIDSIEKTFASMGGGGGVATIYASGGTGNYRFQWSNGAMGMSAFDLAAGDYFCTITDENGCTITSSIISIASSTSTESISFLQKVNVYPNPANEQCTILLPEGIEQVEIEVFSINGSLMYSKSFSNTKIELNTISLPSGVYLIRIKSKQRYLNSVRLVKQ